MPSETQLVREMMELNRVTRERLESIGIKDFKEGEEDDDEENILEESNL